MQTTCTGIMLAIGALASLSTGAGILRILLLDVSDFLRQTLSDDLPFPKSASHYTQHHHLES
jgi:hypothetical protein